MRRASRICMAIVALAVPLSLATVGWGAEPAPDPSITRYVEINVSAPSQLKVFSFLVGQWGGDARVTEQDGSQKSYRVEWVGRYVLAGMAIADEMYAADLPNRPLQGISFRSFDSRHGGWVVEFLNVTGNFLRKQVGKGYGEVRREGKRVTILQSGSGALLREHYDVPDPDHFIYSMDMSRDEGKTWREALVVMNMQRKSDSGQGRGK
jgi:hypothetical protein